MKHEVKVESIRNSKPVVRNIFSNQCDNDNGYP